MTVTELHVFDLRCAACAEHIEEELRQQAGVASVDVDYSHDRAGGA
jgi:copper chaperone CopZ